MSNIEKEIVSGMLVKTSLSTPLTGQIINTVDTEYPMHNTYSVDIMQKLLTPPINKLVNGDFLHNQRGQSEYNFNTNGKYGLDMWMHRQGAYTNALILSPIKGGGCHIKLGSSSMGGLRQYLNKDDLKIGEKYTTVISINNVRFKGTISLETSAIDKTIIDNEILTITFYHNSNDDKIYYSLWFKKSGYECDINYIDLFEGDIAYRHIKEDYTISLMRCRKYYRTHFARYVKYITHAGYDYFKLTERDIILKEMYGNPTVDYANIEDVGKATLFNIGSVNIYIASQIGDHVMISTSLNANGTSIAEQKLVFDSSPL